MDFFTAPDGIDLFIFTAVHTQITFKGMPGAAPEGHFWSWKVLCRESAIWIYRYLQPFWKKDGEIFEKAWANPLTGFIFETWLGTKKLMFGSPVGSGGTVNVIIQLLEMTVVAAQNAQHVQDPKQGHLQNSS